MNEAINERLDAARAELLAALEAHLAFPPHGGNVRGRADSQARVDAASAEVERLRKAMRLLGNAPEAAHAPAPALAVARAAPVPKELGEKILSEEAFEVLIVPPHQHNFFNGIDSVGFLLGVMLKHRLGKEKK